MSEDYSAFCDCWSDDPCTFLKNETRTARKEHCCGECGGRIGSGEKYEYVAGIQCGDWWDCKTCERCVALVEWIKAHVPCFCRMYGGLFEDSFSEMVHQARQTPGFAFGILRRVVAINKAKLSCAAIDAARAK